MEELLIELGPDVALRIATLVKNGGSWPMALAVTAVTVVAWWLKRRKRAK